MGTDGVDDDPSFQVLLAEEGQQDAYPHVHPVGDGEADEEDAHQQPPGELECFVVDDHVAIPVLGLVGMALRLGGERRPTSTGLFVVVTARVQ